jgi:flagellar biosynthesis/type III secretory pathway protein FliH
MLFTEWNQDDAIAVAREEALEDGIEIGMEKGREEGIDIGREELFALLESGVSLAEAKKLLRG